MADDRKEYNPAPAKALIDPYEHLAAAVIIRAVEELTGEDTLGALDSFAWLVDDQSSAPLWFAVANLGEPRHMLRTMAPNFNKRPNRLRKGKQS